MSSRYDCGVCGVFINDQRNWEEHFMGRRHQSNLNRFHTAQENFRRRQASEVQTAQASFRRQQAAEHMAAHVNHRRQHAGGTHGAYTNFKKQPTEGTQAAQDNWRGQQGVEARNLKSFCSVCGVWLRKEDYETTHMKGKRHIANAETMKLKSECGVFVSGISSQAKTEDVRKYFSSFGELADLIHIPGKSFAILQYKDSETAKKVLHGSFIMDGRRLTMKPRKVVAPRPRPEKGPPPTPPDSIDLKEIKKVLESSSDLQALVESIECPPGSERKFEELCRDLEEVFKPSFPHCSACPFGSTVTGLALKGSDLDVVLDLGELPVGAASTSVSLGAESTDADSDPLSPKNLVIKGRLALRRSPQKFTQVIGVTKAKIPIIKFIHCSTRISCDVSFRNIRGVYNSQLICFLVSLDPRIRPYLMVIKYWVRVHSLASSGKMSNYALVMMALFYLQGLERPLVPTVAQLQSSSESDLIDGWMYKFNKDISCVNPAENKSTILELLYGFFKYFAEFDYAGSVISPLIGKTIPKSLFAVRTKLPDELHLYKENEEAKFKYSTDMCVQDPFDLSHNLTGRMGPKSLRSFCAQCQNATEVLGIILKEDESKRVFGLTKLFDVNKKSSATRSKFKLTCNQLTMTIPVGQYLSLGYVLSGANDSGVTNGDGSLRKLKIAKWFALVYDIVGEILQRVMKFTVSEESEVNASKVQKVGEPSDVHLKASCPPDEIGFSSRTIYCEGAFNVWDGRKKVRKSLNLDQNLNVIATEEIISNVLMETGQQNKETPEPIINFSCSFDLELSPVIATLTFQREDSKPKCFIPVMNFLMTRLPGWVERSMNSLMKDHCSKNPNPLKPSSSKLNSEEEDDDDVEEEEEREELIEEEGDEEGAFL